MSTAESECCTARSAKPGLQPSLLMCAAQAVRSRESLFSPRHRFRPAGLPGRAATPPQVQPAETGQRTDSPGNFVTRTKLSLLRRTLFNKPEQARQEKEAKDDSEAGTDARPAPGTRLRHRFNVRPR